LLGSKNGGLLHEKVCLKSISVQAKVWWCSDAPNQCNFFLKQTFSLKQKCGGADVIQDNEIFTQASNFPQSKK